ncbi:MAG: hypothetical protein AB1791_02225 [Chloroflexota bacterium]
MTEASQALVPLDEKQVDFYGDELAAVFVGDLARRITSIELAVCPI